MTDTASPFRGTDRFQVLRELGSGGMGVVYEAEDQQRGSRVALKTLQKLDDATLYRFKQEFRSLADVSHPNLIELHELISHEDNWFFVMELVDGVDFLEYVRGVEDSPPSGPTMATFTAPTEFAELDATVDAGSPTEFPGADRRRPPLSTDMQFRRLREAAHSLVEGIGALHRAGKLHRDVKPSNIMVSREGRVILLDFGLVTELAQDVDAKSQFRFSGTIAYMPPEQATGEALSGASDWYAVGATLYETLTGQWPFNGGPREIIQAKLDQDEPPHPSTLATGLPQDLADLCVHLLRRNPEDRPPEAEIRERLGMNRTDAPESRATRQNPFVGRDSYLSSLAQAAEQVRHGTTVAVYVHGSSGAGKSAVLERFLESIPASMTVLRGRCYEDESVPYKAVDSLIDALSRHLRGLSPDERDTVLPDTMSALARLFQVLQPYAGTSDAPGIDDPLELRRTAFLALRELLRRLGQRTPLVLFIDDIQWGDADSAALLSDLLRPPHPPRALFLGAYRSEYADTSPCVLALRDVLRPDGESLDVLDLPVEPLSDDEARDLIREVAGDIDPDVVARIVTEAQGHPYFLAELAQSRRDGSNWGDGESVNLDELLWRRVSRLPEAARKLMEAIAVSGRPLRQVDAYQSVAVGVGDRGALSQLRASTLVRTDGPGIHDAVETYHDRIRETVIERLEPDTRISRHRSLAETLELGDTADPEALAYHFHGGGVSEKAGTYYALAGQAADQALAFDRASRMYRASLDARPVAGAEGRELHTRLGESLSNAGRGHDAARAFLDAAESAPDQDALELQAKSAYQLCISGHLDEGRDRFGHVLAELGMPLPGSPVGALLSYLRSRARLFFRGVRFRERNESDVSPSELRRFDIVRSVAVGLSMPEPIAGADFQTRSLLLALKTGEPKRVALAVAWEASHASLGGRSARKRTDSLLARARDLAERTGDPHARGLVEHATGVSQFFFGDFSACRDHCDRAREIFNTECTGVSWERASSKIFGFWGVLLQGDVAELRRRYPVLLQEARDKDDLFAETNLISQGGTLARLGDDDPHQALEEMDEVFTRWTPTGFTIQHLADRFGRFYVALYQGDAEAAWKLVPQTWADGKKAMHLRVQYIRIYLSYLSGAAAIAMASSPGGSVYLKPAKKHIRSLEKERMPWADTHAYLLRAAVYHADGDNAAAIRELRRAESACTRQGFILAGASARARLGELVEGDRGHEWAVVARSQFAAQGVVDPKAMTRMYAPGFGNSP